jgi:hypothetical protein
VPFPPAAPVHEALATRHRLRAIEDRWIPRLEQALAEVTLALEEQELADAIRLRLAGSPGPPARRDVSLAAARETGVPDPYNSVQMTYALARWQPPGQSPRSGQLLVKAGASAGSTVAAWIDASGAVASPPPDYREIAGDVCIAGVVTSLVTILLLLESNALARRALDRRRLSAWDADWRVTGPLWSGHRS